MEVPGKRKTGKLTYMVCLCLKENIYTVDTVRKDVEYKVIMLDGSYCSNPTENT